MLLKCFEDVDNKYVGIVKVKVVGTVCVRVFFDWMAMGADPQEFILHIGKGAEVEVLGWAERKGMLGRSHLLNYFGLTRFRL